jgi:hypothetical protein
MARPPKPTQKRYRGRTRHNMVTIKKHLLSLVALQAKLLAGPVGNYPNQLYSNSDSVQVAFTQALVNQWLAATGPIPSR